MSWPVASAVLSTALTALLLGQALGHKTAAVVLGPEQTWVPEHRGHDQPLLLPPQRPWTPGSPTHGLEASRLLLLLVLGSYHLPRVGLHIRGAFRGGEGGQWSARSQLGGRNREVASLQAQTTGDREYLVVGHPPSFAPAGSCDFSVKGLAYKRARAGQRVREWAVQMDCLAFSLNRHSPVVRPQTRDFISPSLCLPIWEMGMTD